MERQTHLRFGPIGCMMICTGLAKNTEVDGLLRQLADDLFHRSEQLDGHYVVDLKYIALLNKRFECVLI